MEKYLKISMPVAAAAFGVLFIAVSKPSGQIGFAVFGALFIAAAVFMAAVEIKDMKIRKLYENDPEEYERRYGDDEDEDLTEEEKELEQIKEYDVDSGKGYCPHCGNYSVAEGRCEVCGEKVTE